MAKEDKPLEYQRRFRDTKGVAQRLDLDYLRRPALLCLLRKRAHLGSWSVAAAGLRAAGAGHRRQPARLVQNGPLSEAHAIFEKRCEVCHTQAFGGVPDKACQQCHDGAAHPAKLIDTAHADTQVRCADATWSIAARCGCPRSPTPTAPPAMRKSAAHATGAKVPKCHRLRTRHAS